jgi:hypothetical protein
MLRRRMISRASLELGKLVDLEGDDSRDEAAAKYPKKVGSDSGSQSPMKNLEGAFEQDRH